ncbi:outer membrane porin, OprD family, partial [Burkholderia pseudomallei]
LARVSIARAARADDPAPAAPPQPPSAATLAQQATTPNAHVKADATQAVQPQPPMSSQAKSQGFIADTQIDVLLRNYADVL